MFKYLVPYLHWFILGLFLALLINASELAAPYIMKIVIDDYIIARDPNVPIRLLGIIFLCVVVAESLCTYIKAFVLNHAGQQVLHNLRIELFSHLQHLPLAFFDKQATGRLVTRVTNDIEALNEMYTHVLVQLLQDMFMLAGIFIVMASMNIQLTLVSCIVVPLMILVVHIFTKKARESFKKVRRIIGSINAFLAENISGMRIVQIFGVEPEKFREFQQVNARYEGESIHRVVLMGLFWASAEYLNTLAIGILLWFCIPRVFSGVIEIGVLFAFITYIQKIFKPIRNLSEQYATVLAAGVAAERIFEILDQREGFEDLAQGREVTDAETRGEIEFRNVWFSYDNENWVLRDLNFTVQPGEMVAFVGATGSGKTTIMSILTRFYEVQKGEVLLDGINIKAMQLNDLRRRVAVVMQDVFLFAGDISSNIRLNNDDIPRETVIEAAKYVNAHEFIQALPANYEEEVKERGSTLSAGQRQLLSFARAITFQPSIMVLDEATANIDTTTEGIIQDSLAKIARDKTLLVVAHRLSTIQHADKIIVIHKGRIRETGNHTELLKKGGIYTSLYKLQYAHLNNS